jgi:hypothetical protein
MVAALAPFVAQAETALPAGLAGLVVLVVSLLLTVAWLLSLYR